MVAVYPGTFDPTTMGHLDIIKRASNIVDKLIVAVLENPVKNPLFTVSERRQHLCLVTAGMENVSVTSFTGLLVDFAKENDVKMVVRGLRALTDFEYEFQMALTNRELNKDLETLLIPTSKQYLFLSSSVVKEIAMFGGNYLDMVPEIVRTDLERKFSLDQ